MNFIFKTYTTMVIVLFLIFSTSKTLVSQSTCNDTIISSAHFDLDACDSNTGGSNADYSEFTATIDNHSDCSTLEIVGGYLYRDNPETNLHSCTPGVNDTPGMCFGYEESCELNTDSDKSLKIKVRVTPSNNGTGSLTSFSFYEQAIDEFVWIDGDSGPNNYPSLFSVRVIKDGTEIFHSEANPTEQQWNLNTFDFSDNEEFVVSETTTFTIELQAYCPIDNEAPIAVWDVDELTIVSDCSVFIDGGELSGGPFEFCVGDGVADNVSDLNLSGNTGTNSQYIVTDEDGNILGLPGAPEDVDFDGAGAGVCLMWHLSYEDGITGLELENNVENLQGCFEISNSITVVRNQPEGGELNGGPFTFCVGDGIADHVSDVSLSGNSGPNSQYIVTSEDGTILGLPSSPEEVDFDGAGAGVCFIYNISYEDGLLGLELGNNAMSGLEGCFNLSNAITVNRNQPEGGELSGGPFEFCVGDGIADHVSGVELAGNSGGNSQYIVTAEDGTILGLPSSPEDVDFDGAGAGVCLIWHLSYEEGLEGLELENNIENLQGCLDLSNSVTVTRNQPEGGELLGGPFEFCVGDGMPDIATGVELSGGSGTNSQYVITDETGFILGLPSDLSEVDFDGAGAGVCLIWHLGYEDGLEGLELENNIESLDGCFALSNSISVNRVQPQGGELSGGPFTFCVGDGIADHVSGIESSGSSGSNSQYVITDQQGNILGLPDNVEDVDFDDAGFGVCLIWHLSYEDGLEGLEVENNIESLQGCFAFSNSITVDRTDIMGGELIGGPFDFCVGNGIPDHVSGLELSGSTGSNSQYVITNEENVIIGLPDTLENVDFDGAGPGVCFIWHLSYGNGLEGLELDNNIESLEGCFAFSNSVTVNRTEILGGTLSGGPFGFCVDDGEPDMVSGLSLSGNTGMNAQYVITDEQGNIVGLPDNPEEVNFDEAGLGVCIIYHLSYQDGLEGLEVENNIENLDGCFAFSNGVTVSRDHPVGGVLEGGPLEFCVGDGISDFATDITLSGNEGMNSKYIITDESLTIIALPSSPSGVNFDEAVGGVCFIYHISFADDGIEGLQIENNIEDIQGCFDLSNAVTVNRTEVNGGELEGGPFEFCVGDGIPDHVSDISLSGTIGANSQYVVTDEAGTILGLPAAPEDVDFDGAGTGVCLIWHLSYEDGLSGLELANNIEDLEGCFEFSNSITVTRITGGDDCETLPTSSIVINEFSADEKVEFKNISDETISIADYWICQFPFYDRLGNLTISCGGDLELEPGEIVTINAEFDLTELDGELALYNDNDFTNSDAIMDYVEWGSTGHTRSPVAIDAGIWTAGDFVPSFTAGNSLEYDGDGDSSSDWSDDASSPCEENLLSEEPQVNFAVFPNPAFDFINIDAGVKMEGDVEIEIINIYGRVIKTHRLSNNSESMKIDVSTLRPGQYFLRMNGSLISQTESFIHIK